MPRTPVTPDDARRGSRMRALRKELGLTQGAVLGEEKRPQVVDAESGRDRLRGQFLFHYAAATGLPVEKLRAYAIDETVSLDELMAERKIVSRQTAAPAVAPTRTVELDSHRDRLWVQAALEQSGFDRGISAHVALTMELYGAESPDSVIARARELAYASRAEAKGKLIASPEPPHPPTPPPVSRNNRPSRARAEPDASHERSVQNIPNGSDISRRKRASK